MIRDRWRTAMLAALFSYGVVNTILYAGLMPLWDGFDEPFHYGNVQQLSRHRALPVAGATRLSVEVWDSLSLAPASHVVQQNLPHVMTFDRYFELSEEDRMELRRRLEQLNPQKAAMESGSANYEALQAPLAYGLLAPFDALWSHLPLPARIFRLRVLCGISSLLATGLLALKLGGQLQLPGTAQFALVFLLFSSQMFYATVAHMANDWLALPLFTLFVSTCISLYRDPTPGTAAAAGLALAAGLLTKAYFLSLAPLALVIIFSRVKTSAARLAAVFAFFIAAPWYARNLWLYGDLSGMQETRGGATIRDLLAAGIQLPWFRSLLKTAETSIWTGNNSFSTFHSATVRLMLMFLFAAACLYVVRSMRNGLPVAERLVIGALVSFGAGLAYSTVVTFWFTKGAGISTSQWYVQPIVPAGLALLLIGLTRSGPMGRTVTVAMMAGWAYVMCATYIAKLIPLYGGYGGVRATVPALVEWYGGSFGKLCGNLSAISLLPAGVLLPLTVVTVVSALGIAIVLSIRIAVRGFE